MNSYNKRTEIFYLYLRRYTNLINTKMKIGLSYIVQFRYIFASTNIIQLVNQRYSR